MAMQQQRVLISASSQCRIYAPSWPTIPRPFPCPRASSRRTSTSLSIWLHSRVSPRPSTTTSTRVLSPGLQSMTWTSTTRSLQVLRGRGLWVRSGKASISTRILKRSGRSTLLVSAQQLVLVFSLSLTTRPSRVHDQRCKRHNGHYGGGAVSCLCEI